MTLFVYGSLRRGQYNHVRYSIDMRRCQFVGMGKTKPAFTLVDFGQYPGLYVGGKTAVTGELYEVPDGHPMLLDIERMEVGAGYKRVELTLEDGRVVTAYAQSGVIPSYYPKRVEGGDWAKHHVPTEGEVRHMESQAKHMVEFAHEDALAFVKASRKEKKTHGTQAQRR